MIVDRFTVLLLLALVLINYSFTVVFESWRKIKRKTSEPSLAIGVWASASLLIGGTLTLIIVLLLPTISYAAIPIGLVIDLIPVAIILGILGNAASFSLLTKMIIDGKITIHTKGKARTDTRRPYNSEGVRHEKKILVILGIVIAALVCVVVGLVVFMTISLRGMATGHVPSGMVPVSTGSFQMGDQFNEGHDYELPVHTVHISAFQMEQYPVPKALWDEVYNWATHSDRGANAYSFDNSGFGQATHHPVHTVSWYDAVKWCNARSEKEGLTPAYYTSAGRTPANVYRTGRVDVRNDWVRWDSGYRLPTEAEWEYAARGGLSGKRFPWGDHIDHENANYRARGDVHYYDDGPDGGAYHPQGLKTRSFPYTTPVNYFPANDYGLYDLAGNVFDWTWDWWSGDEYARGTGTDPREPSEGTIRVLRGGSWMNNGYGCRVAHRYRISPGRASSTFGFRAVLPAQ